MPFLTLKFYTGTSTVSHVQYSHLLNSVVHARVKSLLFMSWIVLIMWII